VNVEGVKLRRFRRAMSFGILLLIYAALTSCGPNVPTASVPEHDIAPDGDIVIKLFDEVTSKPLLEDATVRVINPQMENQASESDNDDHDKLAIHDCTPNQSISVWVPGYYIKSFPCEAYKLEYQVPLRHIVANNTSGYAWIGAQNCNSCHSAASGHNEYEEWKLDGHSKGFTRPYLLTMYLGTHVNGTLSPQTNWNILDDGQKVRLAANQMAPDYYGPGYRLDYPDDYGSCGFCHMPTAVNSAQQEVDLSAWKNDLFEQPMTVETEGITCDVCHKVTDVLIGEDKLPFPERPGILSFSLLLPELGQNHYVGPLADHSLVGQAPDPATNLTCSPVFSESEFCAACHYGKFSDVLIYNSYGEWLKSPYSKSNRNYRSCQDCHMQSSQPLDRTRSTQRDACSPDNLLFRNFSHNMMKRDNTSKPVLIEGAATVTIDASKDDGKIKVNVSVVNTAAGHKFPTDSPLRHLILFVEARDENETLLAQLEGPRIPDWGGTGGSPDDYAGRPGMIYANILKDRDTNMIPAVAYWNPTIPAWDNSDTRLLPNKPALSEYFFVEPSHGDVKITAQLLYRYAFIDLMRWKGWQRPDVLVNWDDAILE
jgi:hypothetical protein